MSLMDPTLPTFLPKHTFKIPLPRLQRWKTFKFPPNPEFISIFTTFPFKPGEKFNNKKLGELEMHLQLLLVFFFSSNIHFFDIEVEFLSNFLKWLKVLNEKQRYPL